jgi:hypothetical protein
MSSELTPELELFKAVPGSGEPFRTTDLNDNADKLDAFATSVLANNWVTNARLADASVGAGELQTASVVESKLATYAVTTDKIAPNAVTPDKIPNGSIGEAEIGANAVNQYHLQSNSVGSFEIQSAAVQDSHLAGGLNASKLGTGSLNPDRIATGSIDASKLYGSLDLTTKDVYVSGVYAAPQSVASHETAYNYAQNAVADVVSARKIPVRFASGVTPSATPSSGLITVDLTSVGFSVAPVVTANIIAASTAKLIVTINSVSATQVVFKVWTSTFGNSTTAVQIHWQAVQAQ